MLSGREKMSDSINNRVHRNTEGLSDIGKQIIEACPKAYVNEQGQVIDPCHVWWSNLLDPVEW
jgi:microsomal dipeptidase-like Zn-dependent dipeptidase